MHRGSATPGSSAQTFVLPKVRNGKADQRANKKGREERECAGRGRDAAEMGMQYSILFRRIWTYLNFDFNSTMGSNFPPFVNFDNLASF